MHAAGRRRLQAPDGAVDERLEDAREVEDTGRRCAQAARTNGAGGAGPRRAVAVQASVARVERVGQRLAPRAPVQAATLAVVGFRVGLHRCAFSDELTSRYPIRVTPSHPIVSTLHPQKASRTAGGRGREKERGQARGRGRGDGEGERGGTWRAADEH
eukprot:1524812-Rhodomonas_salina.1